MGESDKRRDDEAGRNPEWNTPAIEAAPTGEGDELPIAVRRVLASDQHLSQRHVLSGQPELNEEAAVPAEEDETPQ